MKTNTSSWSTLRLPKQGTVSFVVAHIIVESWDVTEAVVSNQVHAHAESIAAAATGLQPTRRRPFFNYGEVGKPQGKWDRWRGGKLSSQMVRPGLAD